MSRWCSARKSFAESIDASMSFASCRYRSLNCSIALMAVSRARPARLTAASIRPCSDSRVAVLTRSMFVSVTVATFC